MAYDFDNSMASQRSSGRESPGRKEIVNTDNKKAAVKMYNDLG